MRLTKEEANAYQGYALTPEQLIKKAKKFYDDLTPEEKNQEYDIFGNKTNSEKITTAKVTVGEFYAHCVEDIENRYKEFKKMDRLYKAWDVSPYISSSKMSDVTEDEKMISFLHYLMDTGFSSWVARPQYPIEVVKMVSNSMSEVRMSPQERRMQESFRKIANDLNKYKEPGEKNVGAYELSKRRAKATPPQTSLTYNEIARFDHMSDKWLSKWCNFSKNWLWVCPCLVLCIFANKGLISAIVLIVLMLAGELYKSRVQEYCSVILPWYKEADIMLEKRMFQK